MELIERIQFWRNTDRIGPDIPWTHWHLYFPSLMLKLCKRKFMYFDDTAQFRPGAFAIGCSKISIGRRVVVRPITMLCASTLRETKAGKIIIEDDVLMAPGVQIHTDHHLYNNPNVPVFDQGYSEPRDVVIKQGSWIGANCVLLRGVTIGKNSVVGAGSVVTKDIPDHVVATGCPAKIMREIRNLDENVSEIRPYIDTGVRWYRSLS